MSQKSTLAHLLYDGYKYTPVQERFKQVVKEKRRNKEDLYPGIFGLEMEKRRITEFLMTGKPVLLTGLYGVAKTDIAKHVVRLLSEFNVNHDVFYVADCPVQEDPMNIAKSLGLSETGGDPCPICEKNYGLNNGGRADPATIKVASFKELREGRGFARVQSGFDTHPEELIGTYNLVKLAEIGDPFDPQVFQPGKIGQASGGVLFVDEVGKLSEAGQYALIQASEEGTFTPTKSRRTFPVDMLLIATTNPEDEDNINGAVYDRLRSVKIGVVGRDDEIRIAQKELAKYALNPYMPRFFLEWGIDSIRKMRGALQDIQLGPRVTIDMVAQAKSSAIYDGRDIATFCDFKEGVYSAIQARSRFQDMDKVEKTIREKIPEIDAYLREEMETDMYKVVEELSEAFEERLTPQKLQEALDSGQDLPYTIQFAKELIEKEGLNNGPTHKVIAVYHLAYTKGCPQDQCD